MLYRITLDLSFNHLPDTDTLRDIALGALARARTINPSTPNEEKGFIRLHKCYHDETPIKPCQLIAERFTS